MTSKERARLIELAGQVVEMIPRCFDADGTPLPDAKLLEIVFIGENLPALVDAIRADRRLRTAVARIPGFAELQAAWLR